MALLHLGHAGRIALEQGLRIALAVLIVRQGHEGPLDVADFALRNRQVAVQVVADPPPEVVQSHQALSALAPKGRRRLVGQAAVGAIHTWAGGKLVPDHLSRLYLVGS